MMQIFAWFVAIILVLAMSACSTQLIKVCLQSSRQLNPDRHHQSLPVQLWLYQLSTPSPFQHATFWELWRDDQASLGHSLLNKTIVTVIPGHRQMISLRRVRLARYLGVVAIFRKPSGNSWRALQKLPTTYRLLSNSITVWLHNNSVRLGSG